MITLKSQKSSLLFKVVDGQLVISHWGSPLDGADAIEQIALATTPAVSHSNFNEITERDVLRQHSKGFLGHPSISGHRAGKSWSPHFNLTSHTQKGESLIAEFVDTDAKLSLRQIYTLTEQGILSISATITNTGLEEYTLNEFLYWLPLVDRATETMDFTGRWSHERHPQRREIMFGLTSREMSEGRSSHDYTIAQLAMTQGANFSTGEVWSLSVAFSGNSIHHIERHAHGFKSIGAGELLLPGEVTIAPGASFELSPVIANYSNEGIDGLSHNFHTWQRSRPHHPTNIRPRPATLNMWEAVYFDHSLERIRALVDLAAEIGIERVVLDDGWFHLRRQDNAGLGDWVIDPSVWPNGFGEIISYINGKGIEFGLWFEGEMVNPDSDLYRAHPEWMLQEGNRKMPLSRNQLVLDLTHEGAYNHVLEQVSAVLGANNIAYIKWDHNRILIDPGHLGRAAVHNQTLALYRLFDELKRRHPGLEIESCSSGGGRIDLGMIEHADRFWTSDNNDALERQTIQRWTSIAIAPELLGTHIGPTVGHQTGKTTQLSFRAINALFGHAGIEWDITETTPQERAILKSWVGLYKEKRGLLHSGKSIRVDHVEVNAFIYGVISEDKTQALFAYMQHLMSEANHPSNILIPGLALDRKYLVKIVKEVGAPRYMQIGDIRWGDGVTLSGAALAHIGLKPPILAPENGILISLTQV